MVQTKAQADTELYINLPYGFNHQGNSQDYVLCLMKNLYGAKQVG
jgi:hypothetical protein